MRCAGPSAKLRSTYVRPGQSCHLQGQSAGHKSKALLSCSLTPTASDCCVHAGLCIVLLLTQLLGGLRLAKDDAICAGLVKTARDDALSCPPAPAAALSPTGQMRCCVSKHCYVL